MKRNLLDKILWVLLYSLIVMVNVTSINAANLVNTETPLNGTSQSNIVNNADGSLTITALSDRAYIYTRLSNTGYRGALERDLVAGETITVKIRAKSSSVSSYIRSSYLDFPVTFFEEVDVYQDFEFVTTVKENITKDAWLGLYTTQVGDTITAQSIEVWEGNISINNNLVNTETPLNGTSQSNIANNADGSLTITALSDRAYIYTRLSNTGYRGALERDLVAGETITVKIRAKSSSVSSYIRSSYLDFPVTFFEEVDVYQDFEFVTTVKENITKDAWLGLYTTQVDDTITAQSIEVWEGNPTLKKYPDSTTFTARATDTDIPEPTLGNPSIDNVFNTKISRLDTLNGTKTDYPKTQAWNADMSLIRVDYKLYDADILVESDLTKDKHGYNMLCSPGYEFKWSNVDPKAFYAVQTTGLFIKGRIDNDTIHCDNVVEDFSDAYEIVRIGQGEGNIDKNDKYVLFTVKKKNDDKMYILLYDIQSKTRVWTKEIPGVKWVGIHNDGDFDWATVSQSGKYILVNNVNKDNMTHGLSWYDINFNNHHYLQYEATDGTIESRGQHGDLGYDINGDEVFVEFNYRQGGITMFNLDHPERLGTLVLNSVYGGGHVSCRNTKRPGWCYLTTNQEGYNEVFALKLDGSDNPTVQRFAQSHNPIMWYWDEITQIYKSRLYWFTAGTPSPDGTKVLFNSRWNREHEKGTEYETNVFMAESVN